MKERRSSEIGTRVILFTRGRCFSPRPCGLGRKRVQPGRGGGAVCDRSRAGKFLVGAHRALTSPESKHQIHLAPAGLSATNPENATSVLPIMRARFAEGLSD